MPPPKDQSINVVSGVAADSVDIVQIYAPGGTGIEPERFHKNLAAPIMSAEWLLFHQENIPFFGRESEIADLKAFLESGDSNFSWWCVTGPAGQGKSRLALSLLDALPQFWDGGFVPRDRISASHASSWTPRAHTLWVIDYAAGDAKSIRNFVAILARRFRDGPFRVRLLLLERGYSRQAGWWQVLTSMMDREGGLVRASLYGDPLELEGLEARAVLFVRAVLNRLGPGTPDLLAAISANGSDPEDYLVSRSSGGNPLQLLMLVSELLHSSETHGVDLDLTHVSAIQAFLARELTLLGRQLDQRRLEMTKAVYLLFITISAYPLRVVGDQDLVLLTHKDGVVLVTDSTGLKRIPTLAEISSEEIRSRILEGNKEVWSFIGRAAGVEDVRKYLAAFEDAGLSRHRKWAVQPDILGEMLLRMVLNSLDDFGPLEEMRPEFSSASVGLLVASTVALQGLAPAAWARLEDGEIVTIVRLLAQRGDTVRFIFVTLKTLNRARPRKVDHEWREFLASDAFADRRGLDQQEYYDLAFDFLRGEGIEPPSAVTGNAGLVWSLPYLDVLYELTAEERRRLIAMLCAVGDLAVFKRLTNLSVFLEAMQPFVNEVAESIKRRGQLARPADPDIKVAFQVAHFIRDVVQPTLASIPEPDFASLYRAVDFAAVTCSFIIQSCAFDEAQLRDLVPLGIELTGLAQSIESNLGQSDSDLFARRNELILKAQLGGSAAAGEGYLQLLEESRTPLAPVYGDLVNDFLKLVLRYGGLDLLELLLVQELPKGAAAGYDLTSLSTGLQALATSLRKESPPVAADLARLGQTVLAAASLLREAMDDEVLGSLERLLTEYAVHVGRLEPGGEFPRLVTDLFEAIRSDLLGSAFSPQFAGAVLTAYSRAVRLQSRPFPDPGLFEIQRFSIAGALGERLIPNLPPEVDSFGKIRILLDIAVHRGSGGRSYGARSIFVTLSPHPGSDVTEVAKPELQRAMIEVEEMVQSNLEDPEVSALLEEMESKLVWAEGREG